MNKIHNAFENKKAFIGFLTAGDPTFEDSFNNIMAMVKGGADLIEIGIPFSDPIAEGPVIQDANIRALSHGMTTDRAFELAEKVRQNTDIPICFMTYLNPVFKYGYDRFFERCQKIGVDGLICPDMPYEEKHEAADVAQKYGVSVISLIAPTSEDRIKMIASEAEMGRKISHSDIIPSTALTPYEAARSALKVPSIAIPMEASIIPFK